MSVTLAEINNTLKEQKTFLERTANGLDLLARFAQEQHNRAGDAEEERREQKRKESQIIQTQNVQNNVSGVGGILAAPGVGIGAALGGLGALAGGLGTAGVGIGAFFLGLAGAEAIMTKFGNGENLKALLTNLAEGLSAFSGPQFLALGSLFTGKTHNSEVKKKLSNWQLNNSPFKNTKWINNGLEELRINTNKTSIPDGYILGRLKRE